MDWNECIKKRIAKSVKEDLNLIKSAKEIASIKIQSADSLLDGFYIGKVTLLYDALREYLECLAIKNGYKIYNHECYTAFLREILGLSKEADIFDRLRKTRNSINYYGKMLTKEEADEVIKNLKFLIKRFE